MVRQSLIAATLIAVASPAFAQEEWTSRRPDGHAPFGVTAGRILDPGEMELTYRLVHLRSEGVWRSADSVNFQTPDPTQPLFPYALAPRNLTNQTHNVAIAYGASERLSLFANLSYSSRERERVEANDPTGPSTSMDVEELGDMEVSALYAFVAEGLYVAHAQLGVLIPTGDSDPDAGNLPYDMRPGAGSFGITPGVTVQTQNERGSVGAQLKSRIYIGENSADYRLGTQYEGSGWIALRINDYFSVSARIQYQNWSRIRGSGDPDLAPILSDDPGNEAGNFSGRRTDVLLGANFYIPEGAHLGGHRVAIELLSPANRFYRGYQLGLDTGLIVGWQMTF